MVAKNNEKQNLSILFSSSIVTNGVRRVRASDTHKDRERFFVCIATI